MFVIEFLRNKGLLSDVDKENAQIFSFELNTTNASTTLLN